LGRWERPYGEGDWGGIWMGWMRSVGSDGLVK
jgi:hypothetical protein